MKHKVGDKVKVLDFRGSEEEPEWVQPMNDYVGQITHITKIINGEYYKIDADGSSWNYNGKWLEPVKIKPKISYKAVADYENIISKPK